MTDKYEVEVLLRPPVEACSALVSGLAACLALKAPYLLMMTPSIATITAGLLGLLCLVRTRQAWAVIRYQRGLKRNPRYRLPSHRIPISQKGLFLGKGFRWTQKHTERLYAARDKHAEKYNQPHPLKRFIRRQERRWETTPLLRRLVKFTAADTWFNPLRPPPPTGGEALIHGAGIKEETDVYMPLSERPGHTVVIARTRHGKTRLAEILITQDIHRQDNTVIVFDPKGDADLLKRVYTEARRAGRELMIFHLGYPALSARYNAIGTFSRITELAGRIASALPGEGEARAFKEFAWQYVNVINVALFALGERPDYIKIRRYISDIDPLLVRYGRYWLNRHGPTNWETQLGLLKADINPHKLGRFEQGRELEAITLARYLKKIDVYDPILEGLISAFRFEREYFQKITAAVKPLLEKLTTGKLAEIIAPDLTDTEDPRPVLDWLEAIRRQAVVYVGLDALTDPEVAEVVGESAFSDLTSLSGRLYKHGAEGGLPKLASNTHSENPIPTHTQKPRILIHADEFSDLIGPQFKTFINKSGGAGFELTLYTQTWSDPIAELGDAAKAGQLAGNIGTQIMMGVKEINTCEMLTRQLPEVTVSEVMSVTSATDASNLEDGITFVSQNQDRISVTRVPMIAPADIVALPKGQAFVLLNGSELWKIRIPLPSPADEQSLPDDLGTMLQAMREEYTTVTDWQSYKQAYGTTTDKAT